MSQRQTKTLMGRLHASCYSVATRTVGVVMQFLKELLHSSTADGSRTNALNHLQWMLAASISSILISASLNASTWVYILLSSTLVILLLSYLVTHFYFMLNNPDALRSEKFTIEKMAIERGLIGDDREMRIIDRNRASIDFMGVDQDGGQK